MVSANLSVALKISPPVCLPQYASPLVSPCNWSRHLYTQNIGIGARSVKRLNGSGFFSQKDTFRIKGIFCIT